MKRKIIMAILLVIIVAAAIGAALILNRPSAAISHSDYDFSLDNPDVARTVLSHLENIDGDARAPENPDLSAMTIIGPALIYEMDNAGTTLTCTQARYYYRFAEGMVGRVDIRVADGKIVSSGSGIHERYEAVSESAHVLFANIFYGEFAVSSSGVTRLKEADARREDYPEETFASDDTLNALALRYGKPLLLRAAEMPTVPQTYTLAQLQSIAKETT